IDMKTREYEFKSYVDLEVEFHLASTCTLVNEPAFSTKEEDAKHTLLKFVDIKEARVIINCENNSSF
ncbi:MAG: hypothetical protein Q9M40_06520, partial [Sulfurimonas sp.]|nr:hypothetical protein [Sulfurimonas sp.]